jgi:acyl-coenzyme A thioesterase PaaI-like protein
MNPSKMFRNMSAKKFRRAMFLFPPIRKTGVKVDRISDDFREWDLRLPLSIKTRNYVGTHFGGTLYSAADPHFMLAWMHILGPDYIIWDKAAAIRFKRPGRTTLHGEVRINESDVEYVRRRCEEEDKFDLAFTFKWKDDEGVVVAELEKMLHFRKKRVGDKGYEA